MKDLKKLIIFGIGAFVLIALTTTLIVIAINNNNTIEAATKINETNIIENGVENSIENTVNKIAENNQVSTNDIMTIMVDDPPSQGGENEEISLEELEKMEEERLKQEQEKAEQEKQNEDNKEEEDLEEQHGEEQSSEEQNRDEQEQHHDDEPVQEEQHEEPQKPTIIEYPTGDSPYYIKVNNEANVVTIYGKDENGYYSVPIKAMICSTGEVTPPSWRYPSNKYDIQGRWEWLDLMGDVYGHYATQIAGNILFHSVPYTEKWNPGSLEWWEYDKLGTACSAGCVRLTLADAWWIFHYVPSGTTVEFYYDSDPGPLGKPWARKISDNVECRGWDPTDGSADNPWYKPTPTPVSMPTPTATPTATPTPTPTPKPTPTMVPTATPTSNPTKTAILVITPKPTTTVTVKPSANSTSKPTPTQTPKPIQTPTATIKPSVVSTPELTAIPTVAPTVMPSATPTIVPTSVTNKI